MDLLKRKEELQKEFDTLQNTRKNILEEARILQQKLTTADNQIQQIQGAYNEVEKLIEEPTVDLKDSKKPDNK